MCKYFSFVFNLLVKQYLQTNKQDSYERNVTLIWPPQIFHTCLMTSKVVIFFFFKSGLPGQLNLSTRKCYGKPKKPVWSWVPIGQQVLGLDCTLYISSCGKGILYNIKNGWSKSREGHCFFKYFWLLVTTQKHPVDLIDLHGKLATHDANPDLDAPSDYDVFSISIQPLKHPKVLYFAFFPRPQIFKLFGNYKNTGVTYGANNLMYHSLFHCQS